MKINLKCEEGFDVTVIINNPERLEHAQRTIAKFYIEQILGNRAKQNQEEKVS